MKGRLTENSKNGLNPTSILGIEKGLRAMHLLRSQISEINLIPSLLSIMDISVIHSLFLGNVNIPIMTNLYTVFVLLLYLFAVQRKPIHDKMTPFRI